MAASSFVLRRLDHELGEGCDRVGGNQAADLHGSGLILVVDDEEMVRGLTKATLTSYGYQVLTAANGDEAVDAVRQHFEELKLVILDLTMPVMGGDEARRKIRAIRPDLPIILSSGYDQKHAVEQFGDPGVTGFIQKPYTAGALLEVIKTALK